MKITLLLSIILTILTVGAADAQPKPPQTSGDARVARKDISIAFLNREFTARGFASLEVKKDSFVCKDEKNPRSNVGFITAVNFDGSLPLRISFIPFIVIRKDRPLKTKLELADRLNRSYSASASISEEGDRLSGRYTYLLPEKVDLDHVVSSLRFFRDQFLAAENDPGVDLDGLLFGTKVYGVGIMMMAPPAGSDYVLVSGVYPNTPAAAAGIPAKSRLISLDGVSLKGMSVEAVQAMIRDESRPSIKLTIQGPGDPKLIEYSLRKAWELPTTVIQWHKGRVFDAYTLAMAEKKPLVVYFGEAGNEACKKLEDHTFSDESVQALADKAIWVWIYPAKHEDADGNIAKLLKDLRVQQYPYVSVLNSSTFKSRGFTSGFEPEEFSKKLARALDEAH